MSPHLCQNLSSLTTWFTKRPGTSFTVSLEKVRPAASDRRSLAAEVEFPHQAPAVIHQNPVFHRHQPDPLAAQGSADQPVLSLQLDLPVTVHLEHPRPRRILPRPRVRIVTAFTPPPAADWGLRVQRLVWPHIVVFPTKLIQPLLQVRSRRPAAQRPLQFAMEPLHLALRLRMANPPPSAARSLASSATTITW